MSVEGNKRTIVVKNRRKEADELLKNIQERNFDADTLEELTYILDHECFYLETVDPTTLQSRQRRDSIALATP